MKSSDIPQLRDIAPPEWNTDLSAVFAFHFGQPYFYPIAAEEDEQVVGCANGLFQGSTGWLGNVIVLPGYRRRGIGYALTCHLVNEFAQRGANRQILIATNLGRPVYERLGFRTVSQYVYFERDNPLPHEIIPGIRPFTPADAQAVFALDSAVSGEMRAPFLSRYMQDAQVYASAAGSIEGFYLPALVNGLVIASNEAAGLSLLRLKHQQAGRISGVPEQNEAAITYLRSQGFFETSQVPRMCLGDDDAWQPQCVFSRGSGFCG